MRKTKLLQMHNVGIVVDDLVAGSHRSSFDELTQWTTWADKVLVF